MKTETPFRFFSNKEFSSKKAVSAECMLCLDFILDLRVILVMTFFYDAI